MLGLMTGPGWSAWMVTVALTTPAAFDCAIAGSPSNAARANTPSDIRCFWFRLVMNPLA
jgi:hypothetical protein